MNEQQLQTLLDNIARKNVPETDIQSAVFNQLQPRYRRLSYRTVMRLGLVTVLLLMAMAAYAFYQVDVDPGFNGQYITELITEFNLSQTQDDLTVTLQWAYADQNRIVLAYNFDDDVDLSQTTVHLSDSQGNEFPPFLAFTGDISVPGMLNANGHFDAAVLKDQPETLDLRLDVRVEGKRQAFQFDFSLPFVKGMTIEAPQSVSKNGIEVRLEQAIITPSMTRLQLCYDAPHNHDFWFPDVDYAFDGKRLILEPGSGYAYTVSRRQGGGFCREVGFLATYEQPPKSLTVFVNALMTPTFYGREALLPSIAVLAEYGIEAEIVENTLHPGTYLLSMKNLPDDPEKYDAAIQAEEAVRGEPLNGERVEGPWVFTIELR